MLRARSAFPWFAWSVAAIIGATGFLAARPAQSQEVTWDHTQIANVNGAMPSIEVDRLGYVHVGWTLGLGGSSYYAYHSTNASGAFFETLVDSKTSGSPAPYFPMLTTDSLGFFHMVWRELSLTGKPVFYRTNNPETRALVKMSFHSSGHTHDPGIDVTADNIAHVITESDSCTGCFTGSNLYDESFTATTNYAGRISTQAQDLNDATGVQQFSSAVAPDGTRHVVFSMRLAPPADNQRLIYYAARAPGSLTWSTPVSITGHEDNGQGWPAIATDAAGTVHVVYSSGDYGIYYVNKKNGAWSAPFRINDQNDVVDAIPSITVDPNGRLHVVFQRYTPVAGKPAVISLHYTTNAFDADSWLDPASEVLTNIGTFELTHQNRKIAVNWVDGQVLVPYQRGTTMWLASTGDVPVTAATANGTSALAATVGFTPPAQLNRTVSNTASTATTVLRFTVTDGGSDSVATKISALHVNAGGEQSYPTVVGKAEGLSYLLGGAQLVTGSGQTITGVISDKKMVFRNINQALWVPSGGTQTFELQVWMKNQAYATGKTIDLRIKPDQDVVTEAGSSRMAFDQPAVESWGMLIVDNNAACPTGTQCNDGNPCTHSDMCNNSNVCVGLTVTCNSDPCNTRSCNGTATCTVTPVSCGGGSGGGGGGTAASGGNSGNGGAAASTGGSAGGSAGSGIPGSGGGMASGGGSAMSSGGNGGAFAAGSGGSSSGGASSGGAPGGGAGAFGSGGGATGGAPVVSNSGGTGVAGNGVADTGGVPGGAGSGGSPSALASGGTSGGTGGRVASADAGATGGRSQADGSSPNGSDGAGSGCGCDVGGGATASTYPLSFGFLLLAAAFIRRRKGPSAR